MKFFLLFLSIIYGLIVRILIFFCRLYPYRLQCKVISVGNITLGGTGKSTLVEFIARYLKQQGHKVAILTRGYKKVSAAYGMQAAGYEEMGDEPYMLQKHLNGIPVIVDSDRINAGNLAMHKFGIDTVILDDGFQQWKIKKDLEILTINADNPLGNRHLLPRGILREPISSLRRPDIFVLTKTNLNPDIEEIKYFLSRLNPEAEILESIHKPIGFYKLGSPGQILNLNFLKGESVTLFCGIGDPHSFENLLKNVGVKIGLSFRFPDHHNYTDQDLNKIIEASKNKNIHTIITTEKDAVRLKRSEVGSQVQEILVLLIEQVINDEQRLYNRLFKLYRI